MDLLAELTGFSKRWVIELMHRLEKKRFIRTDGGSGAVKWIWLLPLGVPRLGRPFPPELTMKADG
jgi:predicted transcriptional regulator